MPAEDRLTSGNAGQTGVRTSDRASAHIAKHSIVIAGHRTSISLEDAFWRALKQAAADRGVSLAALVAEIDAKREGANLSSAIRVFVLRASAEGHLG